MRRVVGLVLVLAGTVAGLWALWAYFGTNVPARQAQQDAVASVREGPPAGAPAPGDPYAVLKVPRWGDDYEVPVKNGVGTDVLDTGAAGHFPGTALPGEEGNFALAAHRMGHGAAFNKVDHLRKGDELVIETHEGEVVYEVTDSRIVTPDRVDVLEQRAGRTITLVTCHPEWSTRERWIVTGQYEETRSGTETKGQP
jgi:sortase A